LRNRAGDLRKHSFHHGVEPNEQLRFFAVSAEGRSIARITMYPGPMQAIGMPGVRRPVAAVGHRERTVEPTCVKLLVDLHGGIPLEQGGHSLIMRMTFPGGSGPCPQLEVGTCRACRQFGIAMGSVRYQFFHDALRRFSSESARTLCPA